MDKIRVGIGEKSAGFLRTTRFEQFPEILIRVERRFPEPDSTQKQTHTQTPRHPDTQTPRHPDTQTPRHPDANLHTRRHRQEDRYRHTHMHRLSIHRFLKHDIYTFIVIHKGDGAREMKRREARGGRLKYGRTKGKRQSFLKAELPA